MPTQPRSRTRQGAGRHGRSSGAPPWAIALRAALVLLCVVTGLLAPPAARRAAAAAVYFDTYGGPTYKSYGPNAAVLISGDLVGGCISQFGFYMANVYVVPHGFVSPGTRQFMPDQPNAVINTSLTNGLFDGEIVGFTAPSGKLGTGDYDIVMDLCSDGYYDPLGDNPENRNPIDVVVGYGSPHGAFSVTVPTDVPVLPSQAVLDLKARAAAQAQSWKYSAYGSATLFALYDAYSIGSIALANRAEQAVTFYLDWVCAALPGDPNGAPITIYCPTAGWGDIMRLQFNVVRQQLAEAAHYQAIADDPPDPDFATLVALGPTPTFLPNTDDPVEAAFAHLGTQLAAESATLDALLHAIEKYQGAQAAGDGRAALLQAEQIRQYARQAAQGYTTTNALLAETSAAIGADGRDYAGLAKDLAALRGELEANGFTPAEIAALRAAGLTDTDIAALRAYLARTAAQNPDMLYTFDSYGAYGTFAARAQVLQADNTATAGALQQLATSMEPVIADLQARTGNGLPTANAGGPYSGTVGAPIAFDASASTTPPATGPLTYAWDLTGSGAFDDATGPTPTFTFDAPRAGLVGVKVANAAGRSHVAYAPIAVAAANQRPRITAPEPPGPIVSVPLAGATIAFSATVTDAENDPLTYEWRYDGAVVGGGATYTRAFTPADAGLHALDLTVSDGHGAARKRWGILVPTTPASTAPVATFTPQPQGGGRNVALLEGGAKVVAVSSQASGYAATNALDYPTTDNGWLTIGTANQWLTIELAGGKASLIDRVQVMPGIKGGTFRVRDFAVEVATDSPDGPYTTVLTATAANDASMQDFLLARPVQARYVRYKPLTSYGGANIATQQFAVITGQEGAAAVTFQNRSTDPNGDIVSQIWDFGDGATSAEASPAHTYAATGTYQVTLTVTDAEGQTSTATLAQRVLAPPTASINVDPARLNEGQSIPFTATASDPDGGKIIRQIWTWGDNSAPQSVGGGAGVSHAYADNGTYTVVLQVVDDQGQIGRVERTITVANVAPTATFDAPKLTTDGGTVTVTMRNARDLASADQAAGFTYAFDCGAGYAAPSTSASATCTAAGAPVYTVKGKVIDKDGGATEYVATPKVATIALTPGAQQGVPGVRVQFTATVTDAAGAPIPDVNLDLAITGDHASTVSGQTGANGVATFGYGAPFSGIDTAQARERGYTVASNTAIITWAVPNADVLILSTTVNNPGSSLEAQKAKELGLVPEVIGPNGWQAKTTADFARYKALVLGDPMLSNAAALQPAVDSMAAWGPAVTGNVIIFGTDTRYHADRGRDVITRQAIAFAADEPGKTGLFATLSQYYDHAPAFTHVPVLDALVPNGFTVRSANCYNNAHIVAQHPALVGITDEMLSNWSCSVHEAFDIWPSDFQVLAIAKGSGAYYTAPDGTVGTPYVLARGRLLAPISAITLAPAEATAAVGASHTLTATVAEGGTPTPGRTVTFKVLSGPHAGQTGTATTGTDGTATFTYTGTATGTDTVEATFVDGEGKTQSSNHATVTWQAAPNGAPVVDAGADATVDEGATFAASGSFTDADGDTWTATVDYGDGQGPQPLALNGTAFALSHAYADNGVYTITVAVDDGKGGVGVDTLTVTVRNVAPTATLANDGPVDPGAPAAVTFTNPTDPSSADTAAGLRYAFACDGGPLDGATYATAGAAAATTCTYATPGDKTVRALVLDKDGGATEYTTTVVVRAPANSPPTVAAGPDATVDEGAAFHAAGTFADPDADTWTATVDYGDGKGPQPLALNGKGFDLDHRYIDAGTYTVTVAVTDGAGATGNGTLTVTVRNVAPQVTLTGPAPGTLVPVGQPVTFTGTFTDPGEADTHTAQWSFDGTTAPGMIGAGGAVSRTQTFATPGVYAVKLTVTDDDGGTGTATAIDGQDAYVVVYDPRGGHVTGGGWIDSPRGACTLNAACADASGKANFGFVAKPKPNAAAPDGETEFQLKAGGGNFHSTGYEWLVVNGDTAQFRGSGTLDGRGDYGFEITVRDGGQSGDRFRIKIWEKASGRVVYDTQPGAADDVAPTTPLGGGSIVIHK
ncbi:MAG TPA: PKD domain-containing protein [Thermomicrobiales bacterium]|nr:PKD domain-containing protein [Thermomicrobiales bacterium]